MAPSADADKHFFTRKNWLHREWNTDCVIIVQQQNLL